MVVDDGPPGLYDSSDDEDEPVKSRLIDESIEGSPPGTDDDRRGGPVETHDEQQGGPPKSKPVDAVTHKNGSRKSSWCPGVKISTQHIKPKDLQWRDIGSGTFAKTFLGVNRLWTTTKNGPPIEDVFMRRIWSLTRGKLIHECEIDNTSDEELRRPLKEPDDIRVELVMRGAQDLYMRHKPDVAEIYSNPRVCQEASSKKFNGIDLRPGWSLDLTTKDPVTGKPWDLSLPSVQSRVKKLVRDTEPFCIVGSPPCTPFSQLQGLNKKRRDPKIVAKEFRAGRAHMRFCLEVYRMQMKANRHFVHEHPAGSTAWRLPEVQQFILEFGVVSYKRIPPKQTQLEGLKAIVAVA